MEEIPWSTIDNKDLAVGKDSFPILGQRNF